MTQTVLFLCPHHAAKSVIAEADFNRFALELGLDWVARSAGTEPADTVMPIVADLLQAEGVDVSRHRPRRVTAGDLDTAALVVSMGCQPDELAAAREKFRQWDDVPAVSRNPDATRQMIRARVMALVEQLRTP